MDSCQRDDEGRQATLRLISADNLHLGWKDNSNIMSLEGFTLCRGSISPYTNLVGCVTQKFQGMED